MLGQRQVEFLQRSRDWYNIFVGFFLEGWKSVKYEEVYLKAYQNVPEAKARIGAYLRLCNDERPHQALDYQTPHQVFEAGSRLWQVREAERSTTQEPQERGCEGSDNYSYC